MKKLIISLSACIVLLSCNNETKKETETLTEAKIATVNIAKYDKKELLNYLVNLELNLLDTANKTLITNKENAIKLLEGANNFAERFPNDSITKEILYRGVMAARGLDNNREAIRLLDKILTDYPNNNKKVDILFEKAFLLDEKMNNIEEAKRVYNLIAKEYPTHQFGIDSKARLTTIDMTDEQLLEFFAKQNAK